MKITMYRLSAIWPYAYRRLNYNSDNRRSAIMVAGSAASSYHRRSPYRKICLSLRH